MNNKWLLVLTLLILAPLAVPEAHAGSNDAAFLRKFTSYRAKNRLSTYQAAKAIAAKTKRTPDLILKRYISASYEAGNTAQEMGVVYGVDAFKESGLSHQVALTRVSDIVGQLTDTLDAVYQRVSALRAPQSVGRSIASVRGAKARPYLSPTARRRGI
jgi:hypothetical protein